MKQLYRIGGMTALMIGAAVALSGLESRAQDAQSWSKIYDMHSRNAKDSKSARVFRGTSDLYTMQADLDRRNAEARANTAAAEQDKMLDEIKANQERIIAAQNAQAQNAETARRFVEADRSAQANRSSPPVQNVWVEEDYFVCNRSIADQDKRTIETCEGRTDTLRIGQLKYGVGKITNHGQNTMQIQFKVMGVRRMENGDEMRRVVYTNSYEIKPGKCNVIAFNLTPVLSYGEYVCRFDKDGKPGRDVYFKVISDTGNEEDVKVNNFNMMSQAEKIRSAQEFVKRRQK